MARTLIAIVAAFACSACIDFVEPEFPEAGAPAVFRTTVFLDDDVLRVNATLAPRFDRFAFERQVPNDTMYVNGMAVAPEDTAAFGARTYAQSWSPPPASVANGITVTAPDVEGIDAPPPAAHWVPAVRVGSDTVTITAGEAIVLHLDATPGESGSSSAFRQWFLTLNSGTTTLRISADAAPPDVLTIPREFVPTEDGTVSVLLIDRFSTRTQLPPGDYHGVLDLDSRLRWTVIVQPDTVQ